MKLSERIKPLGIALALAIICIPLALFITLLISPFWLWIENTFSVEVIGHSGPAKWCYLVVYFLLVAVGGFILLKIRKRVEV